MNNVYLYTKLNCSYCDSAKLLLNSKNIPFKECVIGTGILTEDFKAMFPNVTTAPLVIIDGNKIGGYTELKEYIDGNESRQFLTED